MSREKTKKQPEVHHRSSFEGVKSNENRCLQHLLGTAGVRERLEQAGYVIHIALNDIYYAVVLQKPWNAAGTTMRDVQTSALLFPA